MLKDSAVTFAAELVGAATMFVNGVLTARALGDDGKGAYTLTIGVGSLGALLLGFRWQRPTGYFLARDEKNFGAIVGSNLLVMGIAVGLAWLFWRSAPRLVEDVILHGMGPLLPVAIAFIGSTFLWQAITALYGGLRQFVSRAKFVLVSGIVNLAPIVLLFLLGNREPITYLWLQFAAAAALHVGWLVWMCIQRGAWPTLSPGLALTMSRYSIKTYASIILDMVLVRLDVFILNALLGQRLGEKGALAAVGVYSVALGLSNQLGRVPTILGGVLFNRVAASEMGGGESTARLLRLTLLAMTAGGIVVGAAAIFLIVPIYGAAFAAAVPLVFFMVPSCIFFGLFGLIAADLDGRGFPLRTSMCSFISAVAIVGLDLLWIPQHGIMGAAAAGLVSCFLAFAFGVAMFCSSSGLGVAEALTPRWSDMVLLRDTLRRAVRRGREAPAESDAASGAP